jgi:glutamyl aminopeptidase
LNCQEFFNIYLNLSHVTQPPRELRLSEHVRPTIYDLFLHPDLESGLFTGNVKINLQIAQEINEIAIHTHLLNVSRVNFSLPGSNVAVQVIMKH